MADPTRETLPPLTGVADPAEQLRVGERAAELDDELDEDEDEEGEQEEK